MSRFAIVLGPVSRIADEGVWAAILWAAHQRGACFGVIRVDGTEQRP